MIFNKTMYQKNNKIISFIITALTLPGNGREILRYDSALTKYFLELNLWFNYGYDQNPESWILNPEI